MREVTAWINGFLGVGLTLYLGNRFIGLEFDALLRILAVNFVVGLLSPLAILKFEGVPWVRQKILTRSLRTWAVFLFLYIGGNWLFSPELHDGSVFLKLALPLVLATGLSILAFGPIQDFFVRRRQRRARTFRV